MSNARWFTTSGGPVVPDLYNKLNNIKGNNTTSVYSKNPVIQKMLHSLSQPESMNAATIEEDFIDDDFSDEEQNSDSDLFPEEKVEPIESSGVISSEDSNNEPKEESKIETLKEPTIDNFQLEYISKTKCAIFDSPLATFFLYPDDVSINDDLIIFHINVEKNETFIPKKNSGTFYCCFLNTVSDKIFACPVMYSNISFIVPLSANDSKVKFVIFKIVGEMKSYETIPKTNIGSVNVPEHVS